METRETPRVIANPVAHLGAGVGEVIGPGVDPEIIHEVDPARDRKVDSVGTHGADLENEGSEMCPLRDPKPLHGDGRLKRGNGAEEILPPILDGARTILEAVREVRIRLRVKVEVVRGRQSTS